MAREHDMISPFVPEKTRQIEIDGLVEKAVSFGCSSFGYDIRVADCFKVFTPVHNTVVDPKNLSDDCFVTKEGKGHVVIPPNSFALAYSIEKFKIPEDVLVLVVGKSTYARCGIVVNVTPGEPGWCGHWTLEISNTTPLPAKVYANEGLCQAIFFQSDEACRNAYGDDGRYQDQDAEVTLPR
jgi:dCTP deaminase